MTASQRLGGHRPRGEGAIDAEGMGSQRQAATYTHTDWKRHRVRHTGPVGQQKL